MASAVELPPVPATIGTRPRAWAMASRISSLCSSKSTVGDSPVVPTTTMPSVPCSMWKSMSDLKRSKSRRPSSCIGVTIATMDPESIGLRLSFERLILAQSPGCRMGRDGIERRRTLVCAHCADALNHRLLRLGNQPLFERNHGQGFQAVEQLVGPQQERRIARSAVALVAQGEGFVDQHAAGTQCTHQIRKEGSM